MIDAADSRHDHSVAPGAAVRHCLAGALATAGSATLLFLLLHVLRRARLQTLLSAPASIEIDALVAAVATGGGILLAAWYTLSAAAGTVCAAVRLVGSTWHTGERLLMRRGAPGMARLLGAGGGAVLAASLALVPAQATTVPGQETLAAEDLSWGADPASSAESRTSATSPSPAQDQDPAEGHAQPESDTQPEHHAAAERQELGGITAPEPADYEVRPGDTLWDIAAAHLPDDATAADIAAAWPRWYRSNQSAIGPDPDVILPGTTLHPPAADASATTSKGATS